MKMTRTEELTLSLARGATGKAGDGQILTLIVVAFVAGFNVRSETDLGLVLAGVCLLGVLSVLERRQFYAIVQKLEHERGDVADRRVDRQPA